MPREPKKPDEYNVHLLLEGNHTVTMRFDTIEEFKKWYAGQFKAKASDDEMLIMPMKAENEILLVRPKRISAIHVEPIFSSSVEMFS